MTKLMYIALHKKNDRCLCGIYRTLPLISHASRIFLNVCQYRLERTASSEVRDTQCGFTRGKGTTDEIFHLKGVAEAYYAGKSPLHLVFVDYKKAFDSVNHTELFTKLGFWYRRGCDVIT